MIRSFNRICRVDYDNIIVVVLIVFSLFDIYFNTFNNRFKLGVLQIGVHGPRTI